MIVIRVLIDADGCPVVDIALRICRKNHIPCLILCDTAHVFHLDDVQTLVFDKGTDSVDFALVSRVQKGDLVITQDYGLAALVLGKGAKALNQNGLIYTDSNIENLLFTRFIGKKERMAGNRTKGPKKRTDQNDADFLKALLLCIE